MRATKAGCKACIGSKCAIRFLMASFWTHQMDANYVEEFLEVIVEKLRASDLFLNGEYETESLGVP